MVEVRLITYRRPQLIRRALTCLQQQTCRDWQAVVFDDSPDQEAAQVVHDLKDPRIHYQPNAANLGMVCNTSQAFAPNSFLGGASFACVLEDDNLYDAGLIAANVQALQNSNLAVLARNYRLIDILPDGTEQTNPNQPMREKWSSQAREIRFDERLLEAFFSFTLGNLGYFWRLNAGIDLSISHETLHGPVSEVSRAVAFDSPCWYEPEPLATFSRFVNKSQTPRSETPVRTGQRRQSKINEILFTKRLLHLWTGRFARPMAELFQAAKNHPQREEALQRLAEAGCWAAWPLLPTPRSWLAALKSQSLFFSRNRHHHAN